MRERNRGYNESNIGASKYGYILLVYNNIN